VKGTWENCITQVVNKPFVGVEKALVIAGSDKRGTIYGIYSLSEKIGVSPWYYWADVPIVKQTSISINSGRFIQGSPAVKYRGIFLNDEAPALSGWTTEKFGGFNYKFYDKVFELILRLKGNYLWPAMWGNAFYDDDAKNAVLADEYGVVIGTSHHEPLNRAHDEWRRYGKGPWNYNTNALELQKFWTTGIERMGKKESIVSIGMRGDGDEPMSEESNINLLENIVKNQREIIAKVTGKPAAQTPQLWALYKEVQDYYDKGMRVPDDVTLLLCDDNWGNIRKLPLLNSASRTGGYGVYYHFDYVGGPRNYKWINTNPIPKIWEQMNLAYDYNAREIWIVNVGDLKPMEFPINFFLDYAWDPKKWPADKLQDYTISWAAKQFGSTHAKEIARIISAYSKFAGRRKPELLDQKTYSLTKYREFENIIKAYATLNSQAEALKLKLQQKYHDAYYQLVLHPVQAAANLNEMYFAIAKNHLYASQNRISANNEAEKAKLFYAKDAQITHYYNKTLTGGKWNHMMDQTHIGYTYWQQPEVNKMPDLKTVVPLANATLAVAVEGSEAFWPKTKGKAILPTFDSFGKQAFYFDIFNQGAGSFTYNLTTSKPWVKLSRINGKINSESRIWVQIDWTKVPKGRQSANLTVNSPNQKSVEVMINVLHYSDKLKGFIPQDNIISIEASHYSYKNANSLINWKVLPDYGRTLSAVSPFPSTANAQVPGAKDCPMLAYKINLNTTGTYKIAAYIAPSLDFQHSGGLRYAVSVDDEKPQIVNINANKSEAVWNKNVAENINVQYTLHQVKKSGAHVLKIWMVDPGIVLQKLVLSPESYLEKSYLGPPESTLLK
ncbi:MAG: glycosyl hydrolase, partial [Chitinophagaceae bacterium]